MNMYCEKLTINYYDMVGLVLGAYPSWKTMTAI